MHRGAAHAASGPARGRGERIALTVLVAVAAAIPVFVTVKSFLPVPSSPLVPAVGSGQHCGRPALPSARADGLTRGPVAVALRPGVVGSATDEVLVDGQPPEDHPGQVWYVTAHVAPVRNWLAFDLVRRDCSSELLNRSEVIDVGGVLAETADDDASLTAAAQLATYAAFHHLGQPVEVTGGGVVVDRADLAAAATLRPGDVVTAIDGVAVHLTSDLPGVLAERRPGDTVTVTFTRAGVAGEGPVVLAAVDDGRAILGVVAEPGAAPGISFAFPYPVELDSARAGGVSGGLAWTLAIIDSVTAGDLLGGRRVVAIGAMTAAGTVGAVDGARQKAIAAVAQGADVLLVPADQAATARLAARGTGVEVRPVGTLADALTALAEWGGGTKVLAPPAG